ncbi:DMT family transporter [Phreatobacter aquaticus]|uniref:DMT family transporter n=1 Tax=Phreatobacter aquaticus TaxID=2570229 RepID=A0A4D7QJY2_9HYPH|nr:DMT family transporter [Phreatobacter aquaticus]QCK87405.1 DMT family transporter [Phreatobacter aquaticus]
MAQPNETRRAYLLLLVMPLLFSSNLVIARGMGEAVPAFTLALLRWGVAALVLLPFTFASLKMEAPVLRAHLGRILLLAFLGMWICGALVYLALGVTTATNATLIYTTSPVIVLLIETLVFGRKLSGPRLAGIVLAMIGVAVIVLKGDLGAILRLDLNIGDLGMASAAFAWALYSLVLKEEGLSRVPTLTLFATIAMAGAFLLLPFSLAELALVGGFPTTPKAWTGILALAIFSAVGAFSLYQYGVKVVGPAVTSCFLYLLPVYGVGMAVVFLGESLQPHHLAGMTLVLSGLVAATAPAHLAASVLARLGWRGPVP